MAYHNKKILITGAAGLIGRELYSYLLNQGYDVVGIDNYSRFPEVESTVLNVSVDRFVKNNKNEFDIVFHLAAINGTSNFYDRPLDVIQNNTFTDMSIFNFVETNPNCKLVYASTSEVVSDSTVFPTPELLDIKINDIHNPRWSYRLPKVLSENYVTNSNLRYVIVRFFNLFSEYSGKGHFVYDITKKIKNNEFELIGADETRSFCYVQDAIPALTHLGFYEHGVFNLGSDEEINILTAANVIAKKFGKTPNWNLLPGKKGSVKRRCPDLTKLRYAIPDYKPRSFREIIECLEI